MNPFSMPVHPPLVHFPMAMLVVVWVLLIVRYVTGDERWDERARWFHVVGVGSLPLVLGAAIIDTRGFEFALRPRWDDPLIWHALGGVVVASISAVHFFWRRRFQAAQMTGRVAVMDLALAGAGVWTLFAIGLIAAEMVYGS